MVTQIRDLRVALDGDTGGYKAAMTQKVAADRAAIESGRQVIAVSTQTDQKISQSGDIVAKLSRMYVDGYASAQKFNSALAQLGRGIETGNVQMTDAAGILDGIYKRYGMMADASQVAASGNLALSKAVSDANGRLNEQRAAIDAVAVSYQRMADEAKAAAAAEEIARYRKQQEGQNFAVTTNAWAGVNGYGTSARESASAFEAAAREADAFAQKAEALRAQLDPVAASQARVNLAMEEYQQLAARSLISTDELSQAEILAKRRHEEYIDSLNKKPSAGLQHFQTTNVAYQFQDLTTQAIGGQGIGTIAVQQGPQLAMALGEQGAAGAVKTLGAGLLTLVSPTNLVAIGLVAGAAAAIQFGAKIYDSYEQTKKLDDALSDQQKALKGVADAYGGVAEQASKAGGESRGLLSAIGARSQAALTVSTKAESSNFFNTVGNLYSGSIRGKGDFFAKGDYEPFQAQLQKLQADTKAGKADFDGFYNAIAQKVELNPSLAVAGDKVIAESAKFKQGTDAIKEYKRILDALFNDQGSNGLLLSQGTTSASDSGNLAAYQAQQRVAALRARQASVAQIANINAVTPDQRASAAVLSAGATYNSDETAQDRRRRIADAGLLSRAQSERQLTDSQNERERSLKKLIDDQVFENSLYGQAATTIDDLRQRYSLMSAIRDEAAKRGISDEGEIQKLYAGQIEQIDKTIQKVRELDNANRDMMSRTVAAANQQKYDSLNDQNFASIRSQQSIVLDALTAKTPQQLGEIARRQVLAEPVDPGKESGDAREARANSAATIAQATAENQLKEAQRSRGLALEKILDDQRNEISLIGKTGGAAAALRKEYELTSQLKLEAAQRGGVADQAEIASIQQKAKLLGELTDQYNRAAFADSQRLEREQLLRSPDQQQVASKLLAAGLPVDLNSDAAKSIRDNQSLSLRNDLSLERDQLFRSPQQQQVASRLQSAGLPVDFNSPEAKAIQDNLRIASMQQDIKGFFTDFQSALVNNGGKVGQAFGEALKSSLMNSLQKIGDQAMDRIVNTLVSAFTGAGSSGTAGANAGGGILALGSKAVGLVGGAANDNSQASLAKALPAVTATSDVASYIRSAAVARGIDPNVALSVAKSEGGLSSWNMQSGVIKNGVQEPSFGPFQLYKGGGLGNAFQSKTGLDPASAASGPAGVDFSLDYAKKNGWGSWYGAKNTGIGNWQGINPGVDGAGASAAASAIDKLTTSSTNASMGLGKFGQTLSSAFPAAPTGVAGGGGIGGWFSSLFSSAFVPNGAQATKAASGSITGLFADGTGFAPGGRAIVGERGPEIVNLPRGSQVIPTHRSNSLLAAAANGSGGGGARSPDPINLRVAFDKDDGFRAYVDDTAKSHASNAVRSGLFSYNENMKQQGFEQVQSTYYQEKG